MDCSKLIAFGAFHEDDLWDYIKGSKNPYGLKKLQMILLPTYPSSGSEYGLGAVSTDARTGDFGTAYGIGADTAILVPKYSLSLSAEMTAYTGLVTLVQLSASVLGDRNRLSYDIGVSVMRNVLDAVKTLKENPEDMEARGAILYGAAYPLPAGLVWERKKITHMTSMRWSSSQRYCLAYRTAEA